MTKSRLGYVILGAFCLLFVLVTWSAKQRMHPHLGRVPGMALIASAVDRSVPGASIQLVPLQPYSCESKEPVAFRASWLVDSASVGWVQIWLLPESGDPALWHAGADARGQKDTGRWISGRTLFLLMDGATGKLLASANSKDILCADKARF